MTRKLSYDIPGPDWRVSPGVIETGGWPAAFEPAPGAAVRPVVEIGFCRGEFLMDLAARRPDLQYVGIECSFKRVLKMARRLARTPIENIRLLNGFAELLVPDLFAAGSVSEFWINFPDPWPKRNHEERRLLRSSFVSTLAKRLGAGDALHIATDDPCYAEQIHRVLAAEELFENALGPAPWRGHTPGRKATAYELQWRAQKRPLHFFSYRRRID
jgi:tRNA (guanine-N7-)-methyltransferase